MPADSERQVIKPAAFTPRGEDQGRRRFRARPLQVILTTVLLLFAISLWFLFTARSVLFTFDPAYSELEIDGGLQLQLGERYLLRSGEYQLQAGAPGHYPLQLTLVVGDEESQSVHLQLQRLPGRLSFNSAPEGAQVLIDEQAIGSTPLQDMPVAAGERQVRLLAERYLPQRHLITVTGMEQAQEFSFELEPAWANIAISSVPVGATVYVDGEVVATTPSLLELLQGEHQIVLEMPRFRSWQQALSVSAGVHQNLEPIVLAPAEGILQLSSRPNAASVTVEGV